MNQAIQFDNELAISENSVMFNAQQSGQVLPCIIGFDVLSQLAQLTGSEQVDVVNADNAAALFELLRFDIEDLAETLIKQERVNDAGEVIINC
ncbi:DUF1488 family protein [Shewanella intestini]|uniref:DUF1488 domain-containing protein n=1 Tax=Shewanella intestini TaxID=2017544 RepID=A0ABS5I608_9GAMM|nr:MULTISPECIES: DUF1488 family protein [Shewanella]MBR9728830.1 DUF1488 domain-containing protein [Shewanella intestini]